MNTTMNDKGERVTAIGAPGSIERVKVEWPALICKIKNVYLTQPTAQGQQALINMMLIKRRIIGLERQSVLAVAWEKAKGDK